MKSAQKLIKSFSPFVQYLEKELDVHIQLVHFKEYGSLLEAFKQGNIDMAYLGPLPFISLKKEFEEATPIVTFNENDGQKGYRCVLIKFALDPLPTPSFNDHTLALTQPQSTCGYFMGKHLLTHTFKTDIDTMKYRYLMTHTEVANSVVRGEFLIGSLKESFARKYASLGVEIIANSPILPGFSLVVNEANLSKIRIRQIQSLLLNTPEHVYKTWGDQLSYGMHAVTLEDYELLIDTYNANTSIPQKGNF